ncbi:MAG: glycosyltransferase family 39 protein [Candidatus Omnitrophica bacterium]|nr:glycosyltransferase family 39 protein [Candidatus Omnitrophota bacterium]
MRRTASPGLLGWILAGAVFGVLFVFKAYWGWFFVILGVISIAIWRRNDPRYRRFVLVCFLLATFVRVLPAGALQLHSWSNGGDGSVFNDGRGKCRLAWSTVEYFRGDRADLFDVLGERNSHTDLLAILFFLFGYAPMAGKLLNILMTVSVGLMTFGIARRALGVSAAKIAMVLVCFTPTMIFWSVGNLKDNLYLFMLVFTFYGVTRWIEDGKYPFLAFFALLPFMYSIRQAATLLLVPILAVGVLLSSRLAFWIKIALVGVLIVAGLGVARTKLLPSGRDTLGRVKISAEYILTLRLGFLSSGGNNYRIFDDKYYQKMLERHYAPSGVPEDLQLASGAFALGYLKGLMYFLFSPLPWMISKGSHLLVLPQVVLWMLLALPFMSGVIWTCSGRARPLIPMVIFLMVGVSLYAIAEANMGTAIRHRDMFLPFFYILAMAGLSRWGVLRDEAH